MIKKLNYSANCLRKCILLFNYSANSHHKCTKIQSVSKKAWTRNTFCWTSYLFQCGSVPVAYSHWWSPTATSALKFHHLGCMTSSVMW